MDPGSLPLQQAAKALGVSRNTLGRWIAVGCPHEVQGRRKMVNVAEARRWKDLVGGRQRGGDHPLPLTKAEGLRAAARVQDSEPAPRKARTRKAATTSPPDDLEDLAPEELREVLTRAKVRKEIAQANKHELDVEVRRGDLLSKEEVERGRLERVAYARAVLLGGPSMLAPDLVSLDVESCEDRLREWVHRVLRELAGEKS